MIINRRVSLVASVLAIFVIFNWLASAKNESIANAVDGKSTGHAEMRTVYVSATMNHKEEEVEDDTGHRFHYAVDGKALAEAILEESQKLANEQFRIISVLPVIQGQSRFVKGVYGGLGAGTSLTQGVIIIAQKD